MTPTTTSLIYVVIGSNLTIMILTDLVTLNIIVHALDFAGNFTSSKAKTLNWILLLITHH